MKNQIEKEEFEKALSKAKIHLMTKPDSVFFTSLCFSLRHKMDPSIPTAATDGRNVFYNPDFFLNLTVDERVFLLLHETLHCAYLHMSRAKSYGWNPRKANIAADHVINLQLLNRGFKMPKDGLADPKYTGMCMEEIYKLLPEDSPLPMEDFMDPEGEEALEQEMQDALVRAQIQSKMANDKPGTIPGDIEIFLNKLLNPKLPWHVILQRYMKSFNKTNYTWKRPNRRFVATHYLPSMWGQSLQEITVAIDTSGSVTDEEFLQFITEVSSILRRLKPKHIKLIQFDHVIQAVDIVKNHEDLMRVKFSGRGGTDINPVIQMINTDKPDLALVFTDGYFDLRETTQIPLVWLIHNNGSWTAPYGRVIHYETGM